MRHPHPLISAVLTLTLSPLLALLLVPACLMAWSAPALAQPLAVTVTVEPQRYLVEQIGGDLVAVQAMVPAGADPHTYEPKPSQLTALAASKLYFTIGMEFEQAWGDRLRAVNPGLVEVAMDRGIERVPMAAELPMPGAVHAGDHPGDHPGEHPGEHPGDHPAGPPPDGHDDHDGGHHHDHGGLDPHVWTAPGNMIAMAATVRDALAAQDPAHRAQYEAGCAAFVARATALDDELRALFTALPAAQRQFIVYHPAWGYFAMAYGLTQVPVEMEGKEPGPRELAGLIDFARAHRVTTVFVQPQFSEKSAKALAEAIGGTVTPADPLAPDWEANLRRVAGAFRASMNIETP